MTEQEQKKGLLRSFPSTFWVANMMEFFERGAYYGMNAVLAHYLVKILKFQEESVGLLQGFVYALTYIVPIIGGALAERLGYRRMLLVAFSLLSAGYFITGNFNSYGMIFVFLLVMATGSGLFKPIITGTVARITTERTSGFGFGLYYWCINLGAFIGPLFINYIKGFSWRYVFFSAALWCFLMLFPTVFFYKEPEKPKSSKPIRKVLSEALLVLRDSRFILMIVIYSCFWIIYFQNFGTVLWYLRDFIHRAPVDAFMAKLGIRFEFDVAHVTVINAGTIILLVVFVSWIVKNMKPLPVMTVGITIGSLGFLILALSPNPWMFILGIAVFSIGEMTTHPKYYSYIGIVAPQDKKAVYMGYAFLYGVFGSLIGSNLGAVLYGKILKPVVPAPEVVAAGGPLSSAAVAHIRLFWLIFAALGALSMLGMLLYNRFFREDTPETRKRAWKIMLGIYTGIAVCGLYFFVYILFIAPQIKWTTFIQSLIMIALGGGGILISLKRGTSESVC